MQPSERLREIQNEMLDLLGEAERLIRRSGSLHNTVTWERARSYWIAHIKMALTKEHEYLGGSMFTMEDTVNELESQEEPEEEEAEEEVEEEVSK